MVKTKFKNSISLELLKKVFVIYFSITIIITAVQLFIEYYETKKSIHGELVSLEDTFSDSLSDAIWDINVEQIDSIASSIYKLPFVEEIVITDNLDNIITEYKNTDSSNIFFHQFNILRDYDGKTIILARVQISSDENSVIQRVKVGVYLILLNASIKSFILSILLIWAFKKYMIRPLNHFTSKIESIDFENIGKEKIYVDVKKDSELYILQEKFNKMLETISNQKEIILNIKSKYLAELESEVRDRTHELEKSNLELSHIASTDYLTNIKNRRSFFELGSNYFNMAKRNSHELSILSMDLDNFKNINDTYGHQAGDEVLKLFAHSTMQEFRDSDIFGRVGGEEFNAILYNVEFEKAINIANRILKNTSELRCFYEKHEISFTLSMGIANIKSSDKNIDDLIFRADNALYKAKQNGRNQVAIA